MAERDPRFFTAAQAAGKLGVSRATLYAYVSRGLIRSEPAGGGRRARRYPREDVEILLRRREQRRDPSKAAAAALHWGGPVLESGLTLIAGGRLYYRGHDVEGLARQQRIEEVAHLLWQGELPPGPSPLFEPAGEWLPSLDLEELGPLHPVERCQILLPLAGSEDLASYDIRPQRVALSGARILALMASAVTPRARGPSPPCGVADLLAAGWGCKAPAAPRLLNAALVLCADHELNVSAFTARCVASAGSTPYDVVAAGLAALRGTKHGGMSERVEAFLGELWGQGSNRSRAAIPRALGQRLRRGERLPGFGQPLYPEGDPRCRVILALLDASTPGSPFLSWVLTLAEEAEKLIGGRPNLDFGLGTLSRCLDLPAGSALTLFALGRTVGWIGHAIEEYRRDRIIRPRARYVGPARQ